MYCFMPVWMTTYEAAFNLAMVVIDGATLMWLYRRPTARRWLACVLGWGFLATTLVLLANIHCRLVQVVAHTLFGHAAVVLLLGALILRTRARAAALAAGLVGAAIVAVGVDALLIEPTWLDVSYYRFTSPKIQQSVRMVLVADLQTDQCGAYERRVLERALAERPDVILLAGDYLQAPPEHLEGLLLDINHLLHELDFRAPAGVFAVQGNVDQGYPWPLLFADLPIAATPSTRVFDVAGLQLTCLSMRDSFRVNPKLPARDPELFQIVLGHCPNFALGELQADLLLAGHTHGGQVQLPWIGPLTTGCAVPRSWASGLTELPGGGRLIVSRGVGVERGSAPHIRFFCRPELVVIDLAPAAE